MSANQHEMCKSVPDATSVRVPPLDGNNFQQHPDKAVNQHEMGRSIQHSASVQVPPSYGYYSQQQPVMSVNQNEIQHSTSVQVPRLYGHYFQQQPVMFVNQHEMGRSIQHSASVQVPPSYGYYSQQQPVMSVNQHEIHHSTSVQVPRLYGHHFQQQPVMFVNQHEMGRSIQHSASVQVPPSYGYYSQQQPVMSVNQHEIHHSTSVQVPRLYGHHFQQQPVMFVNQDEMGRSIQHSATVHVPPLYGHYFQQQPVMSVNQHEMGRNIQHPASVQVPPLYRHYFQQQPVMSANQHEMCRSVEEATSVEFPPFDGNNFHQQPEKSANQHEMCRSVEESTSAEVPPLDGINFQQQPKKSVNQLESEPESDFIETLEEETSISSTASSAPFISEDSWKPKKIKLTAIGRNFHDEEGYIYSKSNPTAKNSYFRCMNSVGLKCRARASSKRGNLGNAMLNFYHEHKPDALLLDELKFNVLLEKKIDEDPFGQNRDIYHKARTQIVNVDESNIPLQAQKNCRIYRRKRRNKPRLPKTVADFEKLILEPRYNTEFTIDQRKLPFYRGVWAKHKNEENIVYISESVLKLFNSTENGTMRCDGTFRVLPSHIKFRQLFIISIIFQERSYPLAYILMKRKNYHSYELIFAKLKTLITVNITEFMADYESATRKAIRQHFPNARLAGCFFHYCQAIRKAAKRHGLSKDVKFADAIKEISALALLPNNFVLEGFQHVNKRFRKSIRWNRFSAYWLKQWSKANISVFGLVHRTNNFAESFNRSINSLLKAKHPDIWILIHNLKKLEMDKADEIEKCSRGKIIIPRRNKKMVELDNKIIKATKQFEITKDVKRFLLNITFETNLDILLKERINIFSDIDYEVDDDEDDEDIIPNDFKKESNLKAAKRSAENGKKESKTKKLRTSPVDGIF